MYREKRFPLQMPYNFDQPDITQKEQMRVCSHRVGCPTLVTSWAQSAMANYGQIQKADPQLPVTRFVGYALKIDQQQSKMKKQNKLSIQMGGRREELHICSKQEERGLQIASPGYSFKRNAASSLLSAWEVKGLLHPHWVQCASWESRAQSHLFLQPCHQPDLPTSTLPA